MVNFLLHRFFIFDNGPARINADNDDAEHGEEHPTEAMQKHRGDVYVYVMFRRISFLSRIRPSHTLIALECIAMLPPSVMVFLIFRAWSETSGGSNTEARRRCWPTASGFFTTA